MLLPGLGVLEHNIRFISKMTPPWSPTPYPEADVSKLKLNLSFSLDTINHLSLVNQLLGMVLGMRAGSFSLKTLCCVPVPLDQDVTLHRPVFKCDTAQQQAIGNYFFLPLIAIKALSRRTSRKPQCHVQESSSQISGGFWSLQALKICCYHLGSDNTGHLQGS